MDKLKENEEQLELEFDEIDEVDNVELEEIEVDNVELEEPELAEDEIWEDDVELPEVDGELWDEVDREIAALVDDIIGDEGAEDKHKGGLKVTPELREVMQEAVRDELSIKSKREGEFKYIVGLALTFGVSAIIGPLPLIIGLWLAIDYDQYKDMPYATALVAVVAIVLASVGWYY